ncbi:MAG TPA: ComF family protein, partial [Miltoncostaeaceae bacterium]|nr:ComF family protein [Miltoncostaeaceae bacterium]
MRPARLFDLLSPCVCAVCRVPGEPLCAQCRARLRPLEGPLCACCGAACPVAVPRCSDCPDGLDWGRQALVYDDTAAALIGALKDRHRRDLAPLLARVMARTLPIPSPGSVLVPVPAGPARVRRRGFDQAQLIGLALARHWRRPLRGALRRLDDSHAQRGSGRRERVSGIAGEFVPMPSVPRNVVLIDDVQTTGATLAECARVLRRAG